MQLYWYKDNFSIQFSEIESIELKDEANWLEKKKFKIYVKLKKEIKQKVKYSWKCFGLGLPDRKIMETTFKDYEKILLKSFPKKLRTSRK